MADEAEIEDDVLELGEDLPAGEPEGEEQQQADDGDVEFPVFGEDLEEGQQSDTPLIRHLREQLREAKANEKRLAEARQPKPRIEVGEKPTLASCDYDEDKFETELDGWKERKRAAEEQTNAGQKAEERRQADLAKVVQTYHARKAALPYADKDEMEGLVFASLSEPQQEIMIRISSDPAKLAYALGRNPAKLAALSSIKVTDIPTVAAFGAAVAKIDGELRMAKRKPTAQPDKPVRGSAPVSISNPDKELEKLEKDAEKNGGDRTAIIRFKAQQKKRNAA